MRLRYPVIIGALLAVKVAAIGMNAMGAESSKTKRYPSPAVTNFGVNPRR